MIEFLKNWTTNLVIFIIVISFLEMILPNGNIRKFVKMTIGLIVILVIINPFIKLIQTDIDIEREIVKNIDDQYKYSDRDSKEFEEYRDNQVKDMYIDRIKDQINSEIISKTEYKASEINININENKSTDNYGSIEKIYIILKQKENEKQVKVEKEDDIKEIKIDINLESMENENEVKESDSLNKNLEDFKEIKNQIAENFKVDKKDIYINLKTKD